MIHDEIKRLEKLQRLAEKIHQEAKHTDSKLDDIEAWIEDEAKRVDTLHPKVSSLVISLLTFNYFIKSNLVKYHTNLG